MKTAILNALEAVIGLTFIIATTWLVIVISAVIYS
jgi:hypothetical protein